MGFHSPRPEAQFWREGNTNKSYPASHSQKAKENSNVEGGKKFNTQQNHMRQQYNNLYLHLGATGINIGLNRGRTETGVHIRTSLFRLWSSWGDSENHYLLVPSWNGCSFRVLLYSCDGALVPVMGQLFSWLGSCSHLWKVSLIIKSNFIKKFPAYKLSCS